MAKTQVCSPCIPDDLAPQVQKVLRRLAVAGNYLVPLDDGGTYGLLSSTRAEAAPVSQIKRRVIELMLTHDLLDASAERITISSAGRAWLRRRLSGADPYREQHQLRSAKLVDMGQGVKRPAIVDDAESPLSWLRRRKDKNGEPLITAWQFEAGERLRAEFFRAQMTPRVTAAWNGMSSSRKGRRGAPDDAASLRDHVVAARQRVMQALDAVGPELAEVLIDVCCHLKGLEEAEKAKGWPRRSGKVVLQIALTRLARHYGLISCDNLTHRVQRRIQHWGAEDYRPSIHAV